MFTPHYGIYNAHSFMYIFSINSHLPFICKCLCFRQRDACICFPCFDQCQALISSPLVTVAEHLRNRNAGAVDKAVTLTSGRLYVNVFICRYLVPTTPFCYQASEKNLQPKTLILTQLTATYLHCGHFFQDIFLGTLYLEEGASPLHFLGTLSLYHQCISPRLIKSLIYVCLLSSLFGLQYQQGLEQHNSSRWNCIYCWMLLDVHAWQCHLHQLSPSPSLDWLHSAVLL